MASTDVDHLPAAGAAVIPLRLRRLWRVDPHGRDSKDQANVDQIALDVPPILGVVGGAAGLLHKLPSGELLVVRQSDAHFLKSLNPASMSPYGKLPTTSSSVNWMVANCFRPSCR